MITDGRGGPWRQGGSKSKALEAERRGGRRKVAARLVGAQVPEVAKAGNATPVPSYLGVQIIPE